MKKWQMTFSTATIALVLGALLTFAFAPYEIFPLAFLCPIGLLALWQGVSARRAWLLGFLYGCGFFGAGVYWVYISIHFIGGVPPLLSLLITILLVSYLAIFPAYTGYFLNKYFPNPHASRMILAFPALWVASEWVRSWLFTGFPWLLVGYSQTNSPLKGYAPILGVYGISLAIMLTSGLLFYAYQKFKIQRYQSFYYGLLTIVAIWTCGSLLDKIAWTQPTPQPLTVSLVQGNIPQTIKWSPEHLQLSLDRYRDLTAPIWGKSQLIIWPESAVPLPMDEAMPYVKSMNELAKKHHSTLLMGIPIRTEQNDFYNAMVTLGKQNQMYVKRHLVPFGEYTPFAEWINPILNRLNIPYSMLVPGNLALATLDIDNLKILMSICYEIAFPELMNSYDPAIGIILTVTNDAWFGKSAAQAQHLQMAQLRAAELRRPSLMVSNDGITAIINADGTIDAAARPYETAVLNGKIQPVYGVTPWMTNGMEPILFILGLFIIISLGHKKLYQQQSLPDEATIVADKNNLT